MYVETLQKARRKKLQIDSMISGLEKEILDLAKYGLYNANYEQDLKLGQFDARLLYVACSIGNGDSISVSFIVLAYGKQKMTPEQKKMLRNCEIDYKQSKSVSWGYTQRKNNVVRRLSFDLSLSSLELQKWSFVIDLQKHL